MQLPVGLTLSLLICIATAVPVEKIHLAPSGQGTNGGIYQWQQLNLPSSFSVEGGVRHPAVATVDEKVFFYGGASDATFFYSDELNVFDTTRQRWSQPQTTGDHPPALAGASFVEVFGELWLVGGQIDATTTNPEIYALDLSTWEWSKLASTNNQNRDEPSYFPGFFGSCVVFYEANETLYVIGGSHPDLPSENTEVYAYEFLTYQWWQINATGAGVPQVEGASCQLVNNKVWMFGGANEELDWYSDETYTFDLGSHMWEEIENTDLPAARAWAASAVIPGNRILVAYGENNGTYVNELFVLHTDTGKWSQSWVEGPSPSSRAEFFPVAGEDGVFFFFGGANDTNTFDDVWMMYEVCEQDFVTLIAGCQACPTGLYANYGDVVCSKCTDDIQTQSCKKYRDALKADKKKEKKENKAWIAGVVIACVVVCVVIIIAIVILVRDKKKKDQQKNGKTPDAAEKGQAKKEETSTSESSASELDTSSDDAPVAAKGKSASASASESKTGSSSEQSEESSEQSESESDESESEESSESRSSDS